MPHDTRFWPGTRPGDLPPVDELAPSLFGIAVCLLLSTFTSAAETALTSLAEVRTRQLVEEKGHRLLRFWLHSPERVLSTLLIANTAVNALVASLTTSLIETLGWHRAVALATGAVTLLLLTFGEITPKTLARRYADVLAPAVMPFVILLYYLFYPFTTLVLGIPRSLRHVLSRGGQSQARHPITSEEIEYMIDLGAREGILEREKSALLKSVLEFSDTITREIMVPRLKIVAVPIEATRAEVLRIVLDSQHTRIPVYEGALDEIVGILHAKSLFADQEQSSAQVPFDIRKYMKPPFFVPELMKIGRLLREFQKRKVHLAVVVDEFGGTAGIVALEDVVEEIVGEIQDEQDVDEGRIRVLSDGTVIADAGLRLRDLEETLGVDFPDELDYDSLGGFVTATAGKVPPVGSVILWRGLRFTVRAADERRVTRVEIVRVTEPGPSRPAEAKVEPKIETSRVGDGAAEGTEEGHGHRDTRH
jgi:CBS domain containing-hemolysin-like protein